MPRFYLHICNGNGFTEDEEGVELADEAAVRKAAIAGTVAPVSRWRNDGASRLLLNTVPRG
jgi:hypothetical protein